MTLHLVSWNVAAWMPTVEYMRGFAPAAKKKPAGKGRASPTAPKATPAEAVLHFLRAHNRVDVLALQEVKTKDADLADAARAGQLAAHVLRQERGVPRPRTASPKYFTPLRPPDFFFGGFVFWGGKYFGGRSCQEDQGPRHLPM